MADQYLGTPVTAILVITYLTWAAVSVSGTTPELSTTTGDTVNIPCLFGEGTLHYIRWYFNNSYGRQNILVSSEGDFTIEPKYANRAILHDDKSTLILKEITVADEGTYHCVVDTLKQPTVSNIKTKLNVFSLRPDTRPVISPCTGIDESSSCVIHRNQSFTLTCTLPHVYPAENTKLIWYHDRKHFSSIHDVTQNDDETTDIIRQIKIYETGNFTCNATYHSATGRENTATSVEAWIITPVACRPALDVPTTPGKNMTSGQIAGIIIGIVLLVVISLAITTLFLYRSKLRVRRSSRRDENEVDETLLVQGRRSSRRDEIEVDETLLVQDDSSASLGSFPVRYRNMNRYHLFDGILEKIAMRIHKNSDIDSLGDVLGFEPTEIGRYIQTNEISDTCMGTHSMLRDWRKRTTKAKEREMLRRALIAIDHIRLADDLLNDDMANEHELEK